MKYKNRQIDQRRALGGVLPRHLKLFRLPAENPHRAMRFSRTVRLRPDGDNPLFIRLTQEDGVLAWTSPIYFFR